MKKHQLILNCTGDDGKPDAILFDGELLVDLKATGMSLADGFNVAAEIVKQRISEERRQ